MDKNLFGINVVSNDLPEPVEQATCAELSDLQLALVGGGIGDTIL
jgi:hypothetical protein